ncbi:flagellin-like protein [Sphingomonas gilva]|uniref:Flagellin-like protein n=1 Tax=Sphingomonas gilva TaxID=2305907 RepID=A0A396RPI5_9SPHN|nr:flagellin [Sphingomonas gilva]RHW18484.1 flagellin-like protein [Sphingomonas gilva]
MLIGPRMHLEIAAQGRLAREIARLSTEISGEKRILAPSDDPLASARVAAIARDQTDQTIWKANAQAAAALAQRADTALADIHAMMDRAAELVTSARSPGGDKAVAAAELNALAAEMRLAMAAEDSRGQAVFADGEPLAAPVGSGALLAANPSRASVFGTGGDTLADRLEAAAVAIGGSDDAAIAASLDAIQAGQARVTDARGAQGVRAARIDAALDRLAAQATAATEERVAIEATDLTRAIPELQAKQLTLEAAQAAFTRINRRTLFDLLG